MLGSSDERECCVVFYSMAAGHSLVITGGSREVYPPNSKCTRPPLCAEASLALKRNTPLVSTRQLRFPEALRFPEGAFFKCCSIAWRGTMMPFEC
jgi:hypothetical protein